MAIKFFRVIFLVTVIVLLNRDCHSATFVVPNSASKEDSQNSGVAPFNSSGDHFQYVYSSKDLIEAIPNGGIITGFAYRNDADFGRVVNTTVNIEVFMSSTWATPPSSMSPVYLENRGSDFQNVFSKEDLQLNAPYVQGTLHPFNLKVTLTSPFFYNPNSGNLLIETFVYDNGPGRVFVDAAAPGETMSLYVGVPSLGSAPAVQFTIEPVPEPHLFSTSIFICLMLNLLRRKT